MSSTHGFELVETREIPEINSTAKYYRHERTGLQLLSVENDDDNKCFGVGFKTPVNDDTGVPHILEHTVLNGSRKYPIKEPFVELIKTSLQTFINAMTFTDFTLYPVASTNNQDFYNLVDVYLDAVFYPNITKQTFQQEGWHYEVKTKNDPLVFKGVVFNEMKAAYSSPDRMLGEKTRMAILPDTPYAKSAGGDPAAIPDLTYEKFINFHRDYYHPSQAHVFFYGDDDPEQRLKLIDEFIKEFERREVDTQIPLQPRWDEPRERTEKYDAGDADGDSSKSLMTVSWLLTEVSNEEDMLALEILDHALVGTSAAPLRKALIESGLGEDMTGGGLNPYMREALFSVGLKGIKKEDVKTVENLVMETLSKLADDGIDKETINASLNTVEFQLREKNTGRFPRGLAALIQIMPTWLHGGDPVDRLAFEDALESVKKKYAEDETYFEELIGKYFLNNKHRSTLTMEPDPQVKVKREAAETDRLETVRKAMGDHELELIINNVSELERRQQTPDTPEDLAKIPSLTLADIERKIKPVPQEELVAHDAPILYHDLPTSGIAYVDLGFNLRSLPAKYLPYVPLFGRTLTQMGTESEDFVKLQQRIGANTGGIGTSTMTSKVVTSEETNADDTAAYLFLRGKAMVHQTGELVDILRDILLTVNLDNQERFKQMVLESKARKEAGLSSGGQMAVISRLGAHYATADWASEQMNGVSNLLFLRDLLERINNDWASVLSDLKEIHKLLINRQAMLANVTLESDNWKTFKPQLEGLIGDLPTADFAAQDWSHDPLPPREGFTVPAQVNFVGKAVDMYAAGYEKDGSYITILKHANLDYMWNRIRAMGGAYGGSMFFDYPSGTLSFVSWRDPNLVGTLRNYDGAADYLQKIELSDSELEKAIIGAIGEVDQYQLPDAKGFSQMQRYLIGMTDNMRQKTRDQLLGTTVADFKAFGVRLAEALKKSKIAVVGGPDALAKANEDLDEKINVTNLL